MILGFILGLTSGYAVITALGVKGAALVTVFSQFVSSVLCLIVIVFKYKELRVSRHHFKWDNAFAAKHLKIAVPMAFQYSITAIGCIILQGALNKFGPAIIAGQTAGGKVDQLISVAAGSIFRQSECSSLLFS